MVIVRMKKFGSYGKIVEMVIEVLHGSLKSSLFVHDICSLTKALENTRSNISAFFTHLSHLASLASYFSDDS